MIKVTVRYFAVLRERRGLSEERVGTAAQTAGQLYEELAAKYRFNLDPRWVKVAIGDEFVPIDTPLSAGQIIVFVPPVAGG